MTPPRPSRVRARPLRAGLATGCAALAIGFAGSARAQILESVLPNGVPGFDTAPGTTVLSRVHPGFTPDAVQFGPYTISPNLYESVGYQSNLFGTVVGTKGSPQIVTSPSLSVDRSWSDGSVNLNAGFQDNEYPSVSQESFNTDNVSVGVSHDFGRDTLNVGYSHIDSVIVPSELQFLSVLNPIPVANDTARASYSTDFGRFNLQPNVSWDHYAFGNSIQDGMFDDISYLNRSDIDAGVTLRYEVATSRNALLVIEGDNTYFNEYDPVEPRLDNSNIAALVGYEDFSGGLFNFFLLAGFQDQHFVAGLYGTQSQPIAEGGVVYTPTGLTTLSLTGRHEIEDTTQPDQIGFTYDHVGFEVDHELYRNVILSGVVDYDRATLAKNGASGDSWTLNGSVNYRVNHNLTLTFNASYLTYSTTQEVASAFEPGLNALNLFSIAPESAVSGAVNVFATTLGVSLSL